MGSSAERRYGNLVNSMDFVTDQLGPVGKLVDKMRDNPAPPGSWRVTSPDELKKMLAGVLAKLSVLKGAAVKYETELKTREWKV